MPTQTAPPVASVEEVVVLASDVPVDIVAARAELVEVVASAEEM